jgi:hypothetical protein
VAHEPYDSILSSLTVGVDVEMDDPDLRPIVEPLTRRQLEWIAAWLAGEGFHKKPIGRRCDP